MNWDVLIHWMTHTSEGSWTGFREAVANLAPAEANLEQVCRSLRVHLSDLGYADFFIDGTQRWRALPPVLAGLPFKADAAFLSDGRTPQLLEALRNAAESRGCRMTINGVTDSTTTALISGDQPGFAQIATVLNLPYAADYSMTVCSQFVPIPQLLEQARKESAPINWKLKSFDFRSMSWVDGLRLHSACECSSRFGVRRYYVYARRGALLRMMPKREAVYASAMLQRVKLLDYENSTHTLSVPIAAPLPELLSRAASLCAGAQSRFERGSIKYMEVPPATGATLTVASGQPFPRASGLAAAGR